jgi:hypothetical protein
MDKDENHMERWHLPAGFWTIIEKGKVNAGTARSRRRGRNTFRVRGLDGAPTRVPVWYAYLRNASPRIRKACSPILHCEICSSSWNFLLHLVALLYFRQGSKVHISTPVPTNVATIFIYFSTNQLPTNKNEAEQCKSPPQLLRQRRL